MKNLKIVLSLLAFLATEHAFGVAAPSYVYDGFGNPISSTLNLGKYSLNVTNTEVATQANGGALPALIKIIGGYDGAAVRVLKTDSSGQLLIFDQQLDTDLLAFKAANHTDLTLIDTDLLSFKSANHADMLILESIIGTSGAAVKSASALMGISDGTNQQPLIAPIALGDGVNGNNSLAQVPYLWNGTGFDRARGDTTNGQWMNVKTSVLPTGASTAANQATGNASLSSIDGKITTTANGVKVDVIASALPSGAATSANQTTGNASLSSIDGKMATLGQKVMTGSMPVVIASDQSSININNVAGTVSLPTGASTSALQTTGNTSLSSIDGKLTTTVNGLKVDGSAVTQPVSAASLPLPTGAATSALQTTGNTSLSSIDTKTPALGQATKAASVPVTIASDQVAPKTYPNSAGSFSSNGSITTTASTLTAPANAVGFILQAVDSNTANLRYEVGGTANSTTGMQLQAGRDTGYVPVGANISVASESGTQAVTVQWVTQ